MIERTPFIAAVRALYKEVVGAECYFHLSPCGQCGGPSFQQPCPICNYYPMGRYATKPERPTISCEDFERRIALSGLDKSNGNIATWYGASQMKNTGCASFREAMKRFVAKAQELTGLPSAGEIYDLVAIQERQLL